MNTTTSHFKVSGASFVKTARDVWRDGDFDKALNILNSIEPEPSIEILLDIICGKKTFEGTEREMFLVDDNWEMPDEYFRPEEVAHEIKCLEGTLIAAKAERFYNRYSSRIKLETIQEEREEWIKESRGRSRELSDGCGEGVSLKYFTENKAIIKPSGEYGYIDTSGKFTSCHKYLHRDVADKLFPDSDNPMLTIENLNWVKITTLDYQGNRFICKDRRKLTQAQKNAIDRYCIKWSVRVPNWVWKEG